MDSNLKKTEFNEVFDLMQKSFPENEYRTYDDQLKLLDINGYKIHTKYDKNHNLEAFIAIWDLEKFVFVEHLAVSPSCRGKGLGTKIMEEIIKKYDKPIILEIEPPIDEVTIKRYNFYKRLGFHICNYEYYQQPLRKNQNKLKLNIMSYPDPLDKNEFEYVNACIEKCFHGSFS